MTLSATGEYKTGAYHSHVYLGNQHKERGIKRICNSEPFIKPKMSQKEKSKKISKRLADMMYMVLQFEWKRNAVQDSHKLRNKAQTTITDIPQENKSELAKSEQMSEITGGLRIQNTEWEKITRPSAKVILDPNTANPTLKLSVDGRSVRTKTHKEFHSSQSFYEQQRKYKHQYNSWTCVQAQEGYNTGKHYWEVDVKGKCDWRIGVVKESAPRNGFINLNTATAYWTLRLQLGSLMAMTEPVTKLNQKPPSRIGVYLDLEGGQVSFYDAIKREGIYKFEAEFRKGEKIYPVFGTVETDKPLKII